MIRRADREADLEAHVRVWNAITPCEPTSADVIRERLVRDPRRLYMVAELDGEAVGAGFAGASDSPGRGFLSPRVLPQARRRGIGTVLLRELGAHLFALGFETASSHVDGADAGSLAFARRFGFAEVDRQVEQVKTLGDETPCEPPAGAELVSIADRPELLQEAFDLAVQGYADLATPWPVSITLEEWLRDEATLPAGSFVAVADGEIVGYSGLLRDSYDPTRAEDGLTAVRRDWRRRGLATALKRAELAWAAANGLREIYTWTQRGNEGMRRVNELLGYRYRDVSLTMTRRLPLRV